MVIGHCYVLVDVDLLAPHACAPVVERAIHGPCVDQLGDRLRAPDLVPLLGLVLAEMRSRQDILGLRTGLIGGNLSEDAEGEAALVAAAAASDAVLREEDFRPVG